MAMTRDKKTTRAFSPALHLALLVGWLSKAVQSLSALGGQRTKSNAMWYYL